MHFYISALIISDHNVVHFISFPSPLIFNVMAESIIRIKIFMILKPWHNHPRVDSEPCISYYHQGYQTDLVIPIISLLESFLSYSDLASSLVGNPGFAEC